MKKLLTICLTTFLVLSMAGTSFADTAKEDSSKETEIAPITKEYKFKAKDRDNLKYKLKKEITVDGIEYELTDAKYKVISEFEPKKLHRSLVIDNLDDFESMRQITVDGVKYTALEPDFKEEKSGEKTEYSQQNYPTKDSIPESVTVSGKSYTYKDVKKNEFSEDFSTTITFTTTDIESPYFNVYGKDVKLGDSPEWNGWKKDLSEDIYSQIDSDYGATGVTLNSIKWAGDFTKRNGVYERDAVVSGSVNGAYYTATFEHVTTGINTTYRADDIVYVADNPEGYTVNAKVVATYTPKALPEIEEIPVEKTDNRSWLQKHLKGVIIAAATGAVAIAAMLSVILGILKKKKREVNS